MDFRQDIESENMMYLLCFDVAIYSNARSIACDSAEKIDDMLVVLLVRNDVC